MTVINESEGIDLARRANLVAAMGFASGLALGPTLATRFARRTKPIRVIVGTTPGSSTDSLTRAITDGMAERLGATFVVENRNGAGGTMALTAGARAAPDGYFLTFGTPGPMLTAPSLYPGLPYNILADFDPIGGIGNYPNVLFVPRASPINSVADLVKIAREQPGKLSYGSSGVGTSLHLATVLLQRMTGMDVVHVPYKNLGSLPVDLATGRLDFAFGTNAFIPLVKNNQLRVIATSGATRSQTFPNVKTVAEQGFPGYQIDNWYALLAPKGTPFEIVQRLTKALDEVLGQGELRQKLAGDLDFTVQPATPAEVRAHISAELEKWAKIIKESNVKIG